LSVPLWRPEVDRRAEAADSRAEAQRAKWQAVSLRATEEIDRAWAERSRAEAMMVHADEILNARTRSSSITTRKREAGLIQDSEQQLARIDQITASLNHARTTADALFSHINLTGAIGGAGEKPSR
jgi:outer membrane protein TolC